MELAKLGWRVTLVTSEAPEGLEMKGLDVVEIGAAKMYFFGTFGYYLQVLMRLFRNRLPGRILFFQLDSMGLLLLAVPLWQKLTGKRNYQVVLDYRSLPMDTRSVKGKLRSLMFYAGHELASRLDLKVTAITDRIAGALRLRSDQLIGIWPSGANIDDFKQAMEKRRWPGEHEPIRLVYIGAMQAERNLIAVANAAKIASEKGVDLTLSIIGDGDQKTSLEKIAATRGYEFARVWGPVPQHRIPELLGDYDIGILPFPNVPKMNVSSAIKMFEYMAAGMPILATEIEAHTSVFKDSDFVFWTAEDAASMARGIMAIARCKTTLPVLGKKAGEYSKMWDWSESAKKLSHAIEPIAMRTTAG